MCCGSILKPANFNYWLKKQKDFQWWLKGARMVQLVWLIITKNFIWLANISLQAYAYECKWKKNEWF